MRSREKKGREAVDLWRKLSLQKGGKNAELVDGASLGTPEASVAAAG